MSPNTVIHLLTPRTEYKNNSHPEVYEVDEKGLMEKAKRSPDFRIKVYHDGGRFEGSFVNGLRDGIGAYFYRSGNQYIGEWEQGMRSGIGVYNYLDGNRFCGEWKKDIREGRGTGWFSDNGKTCFTRYLVLGVYTGDYKSGKRSGHGIYTYPSGNQYTGYWLNGKRHGQGVYIYKDGEKYEGEWEKDLRSGYGEVSTTDGTHYKGIWKSGMKNGRGLYRTPTFVYDGEFVANDLCGYGKIRWTELTPDNENVEYEGEFKDNELHGKGKLVTRGGDIVFGVWQNNQLQQVTKRESGPFKVKLLKHLQRNGTRNHNHSSWKDRMSWFDIDVITCHVEWT